MVNLTQSVFLSIAALGVGVACASERTPSSIADAATGADSCRAARLSVHHRASADACPASRPPSIEDAACCSGAKGTCKSDVDCTIGKDGRCTPLGRPLDSGLYCTYDLCASDSECKSSEVCACNATTGNACVSASCKTDSECGGFGCSPSIESCSGVTEGFHCHSACDACLDDSDCPQAPPGACAFDPRAGKWACMSACAPG